VFGENTVVTYAEQGNGNVGPPFVFDGDVNGIFGLFYFFYGKIYLVPCTYILVKKPIYILGCTLFEAFFKIKGIDIFQGMLPVEFFYFFGYTAVSEIVFEIYQPQTGFVLPCYFF